MTFKYEITSNVFFYLAKEIEEEINLGYINNIQNIDYDTIKIKIHRKKTKQLIITKEVLFLPSYDIKVMEKSLEFTRFLKRKLYNQRIQEIKQHKNNKVIYLKLDDYFLIFEFFSHSNIILTDAEYNVISAKRYERWKDREIIRKQKYSFPKVEAIETLTDKEIEKLNKLEKKGIIRYFVKNHNIAPHYINEIFETEKTFEEKIKKIKKLYNIKNPKLIKTNNLFVIKENNNPEKISTEIEKEYVDFFAENKTEKETNKKEKKINKIIEIQEEKEKEFLEKIKNYKKQGEQIYVHFNTIEEINKQIKLALNKKIPEKEIIKKMNDYFEKTNQKINVKKIDLKEKKYILKIDENN